MGSNQPLPLSKTRQLKRVGEGLYAYTCKDGSVGYMVRFRHQNKDKRKFGFPTISKAKQWRQSRLGAIADGRLFPEQILKRQGETKPQAITLSKYAETWMKAKCASGLKYTTLKRYQSILKIHLIPTFGLQPLADVNRAKVRELVGALNDQGLKPKTIKNVLLALSALYSDAIEDEHVQHNPALKTGKLIKIPKVGEGVEVFAHEEEWYLLQTAKERCPHYFLLILLLFRTGLRIGEAVALQPGDLSLRSRCLWVQRNFTAGQLSHTPKNRKKRRVDLSQDLVQAMKECLVVREAEALLKNQSLDDWLFTAPQGGIIRCNNFRDRVWKPLLKAAGLPYKWIHATRHTFATRMIMNGANLVYVQKQLGHSSIQLTVDTYTHWIHQSERSDSLEVDCLVTPPKKDGGGTLGGTFTRGKSEELKTKEKKWGE